MTLVSYVTSLITHNTTRNTKMSKLQCFNSDNELVCQYDLNWPQSTLYVVNYDPLNILCRLNPKNHDDFASLLTSGHTFKLSKSMNPDTAVLDFSIFEPKDLEVIKRRTIILEKIRSIKLKNNIEAVSERTYVTLELLYSMKFDTTSEELVPLLEKIDEKINELQKYREHINEFQDTNRHLEFNRLN